MSTSRGMHGRVERASVYALAFLVLVAFVGPLIWLMTLSFKRRIDIFVWPPKLFAFTPTLENYRGLFSFSTHFHVFLANSFVVALVSTALALSIGVTAAYALAHGRVGNPEWSLFWMLSFRVLPPISLVVPYYLLFRQLGLVGNLVSIAVTHTVFSLAIVTWMMKGFFEEIPREIEEASMLDGCTTWRTFTRVVLPVSTAGLAASAIFSFLTSWNEFLFAVVLSSPQTQTVPVAVSTFMGEVYISWGQLAAATMIGLLPAILVAFRGQRFLLVGLGAGAVK